MVKQGDTDVRDTSAAAGELAPGATVAGCRIERVLSRDESGVLYRATQTALDRPVVVKMFDSRGAIDGARMARFDREARLLAQFSHPNIVRVHMAGGEGAWRFLVMEHVAGQTLAERLAKQDRFDVYGACDVARQVALALDAFQERAITHLGISPENILVTPEGAVKVSGFFQPAGGPASFPYASPERLRGEAEDIRSDIYALGVLLWECLAGRRPVPGQPLPAIRSVAADVAEDVEALVSRMTHADRRERYSSPAEVVRALEGFLAAPRTSRTGGQPPRLLAVDDDEWILMAVRRLLSRYGYEVHTASGGEDGLVQAKLLRPDLVILDVLMPGMDGWTFIKRLRSMPEFAFVPVLFLTAANAPENRVHGFRLHADDFMDKAFLAEELPFRVAKALRGRARIESPFRARARELQRDGPGVEGTLSQLGLATLLSVLDGERKTGVLQVTQAASRQTGWIFLREGRVLSARLEAPEAPRNAEAVYVLLTWSDGTFVFSAHECDIADEIKMTTTHLLMEGARRLDEAHRDPML